MSNSPFDIFRKNLKPMMIVLVFLAMIAFVVLPAVQTYMQRNVSTGSDAKLASFDGLELKQSRVDHFTRNHASIVRFLKELAEETIARGGTPRTPGFAYDTQSRQVQSIGIDSSPSTLASVRTLQYASQAAEAGFELDDTAIATWLSRFTDGMLSDGETIALLMQSTRNQMGKFHLYDQLRQQLLAELYQRSALAGVVDGQLPIVTPVEQWENFLKLNQQATVSAYAVMVEDFMEKTNKNPNAAEILAVYKEGKDLYPNNQLPDPGFRRRETASFEYVVANLQSFVDREAVTISEETLRAEYARRLEGGDFKLPDEPATEEPVKEEAKPTEEAKPAAEAKSAAEVKPAAEAKPTEESAKPAEEAKPNDDAKPAEEEKSGDEAKAGSSDQSQVKSDNAIRLVAFQDESEKPAEVAPTQEPVVPTEADKPASTEAVTAEEKPAADTKPAESAPVEEKPKAEDKPAAEAKPETDAAPKAEDKPADATPAQAAPAAAAAPAEKAAPKTMPFEDVRERLADELAAPVARQKLAAAIDEVTNVMRRYFNEKSIYESDVAAGKKVEAPKRPDLKTLAKSLGLDTKAIESKDAVTISSELISESYEVGTERFQRGPSFAVMMYGVQNSQSFIPKQQLFYPLQTADDQTGKSYVSWKTDETEAYSPELDEAREEVIQVIRTREARKLAMEYAEGIAKKANEAKDKPLADSVPADKKDFLFEEIAPFTWMNSFGFGQASLGNVPELDSVGSKFMREVFTNDLGMASVAPNQPERVIYVVRTNGLQPPVDELQRRFKQPQERMMAMLLGNEEAGSIVRGFYKSVDDEMGFEFEETEQE